VAPSSSADHFRIDEASLKLSAVFVLRFSSALPNIHSRSRATQAAIEPRPFNRAARSALTQGHRGSVAAHAASSALYSIHSPGLGAPSARACEHAFAGLRIPFR
jgi:hypothetical protein